MSKSTTTPAWPASSTYTPSGRPNHCGLCGAVVPALVIVCDVCAAPVQARRDAYCAERTYHRATEPRESTEFPDRAPGLKVCTDCGRPFEQWGPAEDEERRDMRLHGYTRTTAGRWTYEGAAAHRPWSEIDATE